MGIHSNRMCSIVKIEANNDRSSWRFLQQSTLVVQDIVLDVSTLVNLGGHLFLNGLNFLLNLLGYPITALIPYDELPQLFLLIPGLLFVLFFACNNWFRR